MRNYSFLIAEFCTSPPEADKSEAFICKAFKGEAIVYYASPLIIRRRRTDGSLRLARRVKINEIK